MEAFQGAAGIKLNHIPFKGSSDAQTQIIGGNVATNSGGPHTLKYGVTVNHVLGVELVLPDGEVVTCGGPVGTIPDSGIIRSPPMKAPWITYRPELKVLDCTVRDGGLINQWQFNDDFVRKVFIALSQSGVDYMEIGYKSSEKYFSRADNGAWKFCSEDDLKRIIGGLDKTVKLSAMADIGRIDDHDIPQKSESCLDMIRVACYAKEVDKAISLAHHCMEKGYETTINLMAVSKVLEKELDEALEDLAKSEVPVIYLVDSFGAMYSEQIHYLAKKYREALRIPAVNQRKAL